ncbi:tRNA (adenosine(37)-N6)-threonylcarbamoyltransferase complex dimerization subunit type 1 TsaB [Actibacterium sp. XHP0104]|uniref:tRNA (adenosine(37)-N6)-threonylcarbamoyltransferase complex dimerization subunit type 1 TsaB n=1 Tax=Actibacterium sp. XHP0104 TaxID=2984335 RepID=UPI0021E7F13E|nr:tRNA (adenosine(37)-N6)-threonylcarbamoyltransferase complex dimerization subunit type 1 TsaB [Actibacterium sp. XHP0104]MCV2882663.1 tRNA (adenosine(37)-N6)-threonylcarbamoyltransferase complex dimerization subunit type 1 TsaB [Actibacterium sp. XHP0104]
MPSDRLILAFDTSAAHCAAALLCGDTVIATRYEEMARGQAERLMPLLEDLLAEAGKSWADLDAIGVGIGPGNFTGIRISVSAARGLALALNIPAVGVSLFDTTMRLSNWAQTAVPAPRGQVYFFDPDKMSDPVLCEATPDGAVALSTDHTPADHTVMMARIGAQRLDQGRDIPRPAPLYLRAADAAPASDPPPVILP